MKRTSVWVFCIGALLMTGGLMLLASGLADPHATANLPTSAFIFSIGALFVGAGFMIRAREIEERLRPSKEAGQVRLELFRANGSCSVCNKEPAFIRCNLHNARLCGTCINSHDTAWCEYAPCGRKSTAVGKGAWR